MEVALRQRLDGVDTISISQSQQTAEVRYARGAHAFSPQAFREAIGQAGVKVVTLDLDACGLLEQTEQQSRLAAGPTTFTLANRVDQPSGSNLCVSGRLNESENLVLEVTRLEVVGK